MKKILGILLSCILVMQNGMPAVIKQMESVSESVLLEVSSNNVSNCLRKTSENVEESSIYLESKNSPNIIDSGVCGDNVNWTLDNDGVLTISGTGDMYDYAYPTLTTMPTIGSNATAPWAGKYIKKIIIEEGVTRIGNGAFIYAGLVVAGNDGSYEMSKVDNIILPDTLISIGYHAFWGTGCKTLIIPACLEEADFPFKLSTFENVIYNADTVVSNMFSQTSISSVILSSDTKIIERNAFDSCNGLQYVNCGGVTEIGENAFANCDSLSKVILPDTLVSIGRYAFYECEDLKEIEIPDSVKSMGTDCFNGCTSLESVDIRGKLTVLEALCFAHCSNLVEVNLPESLLTIRECAFMDCTSLETIKIPEGVTEIKYSAFEGCTQLTDVTIPATVQSIASGRGNTKVNVDNVFGNNPNLKEIKVDEKNRFFKSYDGCLYNYDLTELIYCPEGKESIIIPKETNTINACAFYSSSLYSKGLPAYKIKEIFFKGDVPSMASDMWQYITATAYYPTDKDTWNDDTCMDYGGEITWKTWQPEIEKCDVMMAYSIYSYDREEKRPNFKLEGGSLKLVQGEDYNIVYQNNVNAGTATVVIQGTGKYSGTIERAFAINKAEQILKTNISSLNIDLGETFLIDADGKGTIAYASSNEKVVVVTGDGKIVPLTYGKAVITVSASGDENYLPAQSDILVTVFAEGESVTEPQNLSNTQNNSSMTDTTKVTVPDNVKLEVSGLSNKIAAGKKVQLTVTFTPSNVSNKNVIWTSSNPKVATVNQNGVVKFKKKSAGKTVIITATAADGSGAKAVFRLKSMKGVVKKVAISGAKKRTVKVGKALKLKAKVTATKGANKKLQWTSSNTKYATVSASGKVKTKKAGKGKTVKITAMATDGSRKKQVVKVRIK